MKDIVTFIVIFVIVCAIASLLGSFDDYYRNYDEVSPDTFIEYPENSIF